VVDGRFSISLRTRRDSTAGPDRPTGQRGDATADTAGEVRGEASSREPPRTDAS